MLVWRHLFMLQHLQKEQNPVNPPDNLNQICEGNMYVQENDQT